MSWFSNRLMRGACNRSYQRLETEFGSGPSTGILAVALGHACYPNAVYGDNGAQDYLVRSLRLLRPCCNARMACKHVEQWLDLGTLSTVGVFRNVWGLAPDEFLYHFAEGLVGGDADSDKPLDDNSSGVTTIQTVAVTADGSPTENLDTPPRVEVVAAKKAAPPLRAATGDGQSESKPKARESNGVGLAVVISLAIAGVTLIVMMFVGIIGGPGAPTRDLSKPSHPEVRKWKDNTGNFETEAVLIGVSEDHVRLQKTNGKRISVQMRRLSNEDKEWVKRAIAQDSRLLLIHPSPSEIEPGHPTQAAEDAMFTLVTRDAIARVMRHVDRPFETEFGRPLLQIDPGEPTNAYVCVQCTYQESGVRVTKLFFIVFENARSPERAEVSGDLLCLLVNCEGKVLERDNDFWRELPIQTQRELGAIDTDGPPWIAKTMLNLREAIPAESR